MTDGAPPARPTEDMARIGDVALRAGLPSTSCAPSRPTSRALFFELTTSPRTATATSEGGSAPEQPSAAHEGACSDGGAITAELRKFFTTRMWWGMAIAIVLAGAGFALLFGFIFTSDAATVSGGPGGRTITTTST